MSVPSNLQLVYIAKDLERHSKTILTLKNSMWFNKRLKSGFVDTAEQIRIAASMIRTIDNQRLQHPLGTIPNNLQLRFNLLKNAIEQVDMRTSLQKNILIELEQFKNCIIRELDELRKSIPR